MKFRFARTAPFALLLLLSGSTVGVAAQTAPPAPIPQTPMPPKPDDPKQTPPKAEEKKEGKKEEKKPSPPKPGTPKPYAEVVTAEAKSDPGVFTVHRIDEKILFEIPAKMLDRVFLWSTEIAQLPTGFGYGGTAIGDRVVRWTRRNNKVYLRGVSFDARAEGKGAINRALEASSLEPIILAFDVEAEGKDKSAVIDVTRLLTSDVSEFSARQALNGTGLDPSRSYIDKVKSFPMNIETRVLLTFGLSPGRGLSSVTALIHYSMVLLPEKPMQARYRDSRVGYFTESFIDYGRPENRAVPQEIITRYRLEKKDPKAAVSEPVKPIVYYISREVPEVWHPWIKKAIEDWQPAFEGAGFKNAIICKEAPTVEQDPDWDAEDVRYSVVRWAPLPIENAMGPHVHDPRSGEILSAHIIVWHDVLKLAQEWYFVQCSPLDVRAQKLPLSEALVGELLEYIIAHEVGHTLGLRHNHKASSFYTAAQLRDKAFTTQYGDEASIMDYGRFNYVAQPGDNARLIPLIGPYDKFAIEWGYVPIAGATKPDAEKYELDKIAGRQLLNPMLRFGGEDFNSSVDPTVQTEDLGSDPIEATTYGLKNIARVAKLLVPATTKYGEDYTMLGEMYNSLYGQRLTELFHVAKLVGGVVQTDYHSGRGDVVFRSVPREKQAQAVKFLIDNALSTPKDILLPEILNRIEPQGVQDQVLGAQRAIVNSMLGENRVKRMLDRQALAPGQSYTVSQMVTDLQNGVWSELNMLQPVVDIYRRNLQRAYIQGIKPRVLGDSATQTELRPIALGALRTLIAQINTALPKVKDNDTALHLRDCRTEIDRILNPKI